MMVYACWYAVQRRRRHFKSGQATTNKRSLVHVYGGGGGEVYSGLRHIASSCTSYTHVYLATRGCRYSPVGPRRAPDPPAIERERLYEKPVYTQGKGEPAWETWPNRLVLRPSLQSGNEANDPPKSGPAKAGPAGPATPPRQCGAQSNESYTNLEELSA